MLAFHTRSPLRASVPPVVHFRAGSAVRHAGRRDHRAGMYRASAIIPGSFAGCPGAGGSSMGPGGGSPGSDGAGGSLTGGSSGAGSREGGLGGSGSWTGGAFFGSSMGAGMGASRDGGVFVALAWRALASWGRARSPRALPALSQLGASFSCHRIGDRPAVRASLITFPFPFSFPFPRPQVPQEVRSARARRRQEPRSPRVRWRQEPRAGRDPCLRCSSPTS